MKNSIKKIIFTGGGSGGHTFPAIAVINSILNKKNNINNCIYIGSKNGIEKNEAEKLNIKYYAIPTGKLRRYFSYSNFTDIFKVITAIFISLKILLKEKPAIIFSTGGFVALPVCISAFILNIPIIIHEQTATFGLSNKISSFLASEIILSFKNSEKYINHKNLKKCIVIGNPIRKKLVNGNRADFLKEFNITDDLPIIYITGGALGSVSINKIIKDNILDILNNYYIIHQYGKDKNSIDEINNIIENYPIKKNRYFPKPYFNSDILKNIYSSISCLIGRSGAGTINEITILGIPSLLFPLKNTANNEQYINAKIIEESKKGILLSENCSKKEFLNALNFTINLKRSPVQKEKINSADKIYEILEKYL